jgi:cytochrome P450
MSNLFLALVLYPGVQKRAQAELDAVISRDRLPTFDDKPRLPYIEAMCKELLRWQVITPLGMISHRHWREPKPDDPFVKVSHMRPPRTMSTEASSSRKV